MTFNFQKPVRPVNRVFIHCSASDHAHHDNVATMRAWHLERGWSDVGYHIFIRKDGTVETGRPLERTPAAQAGHNRGTIAICLHGLAKNRFTRAQLNALRSLCHEINEAYGGAVTFHGHNEVAAKACPVFDYKKELKLDASGRLGKVPVLKALRMPESPAMNELEEPEARDAPMPVLRLNATGEPVYALQRSLKMLGYQPGGIDGHFGRLTRAALLEFQADNHLIADGIAGPATWEALLEAQPRQLEAERKSASLIELAGKGSRIATASIGNTVAGGAITAGGALSVLEQSSGAVSRVASSLGVFKDSFQSFGLGLGIVVLAIGGFVVFQSIKAGRARVEDHRKGKTL